MSRYRRDLSVFDNNKDKNWDEKVDLIYSEFPKIDDLDWVELFTQDVVLFGTVINDIIKVSISEKGRPGKRSTVSQERAGSDLRVLQNDDYSNDTFPITFKRLKRSTTYQAIAFRAKLDKMTIHRYASGKKNPTKEHLEQIAEAFHKDPSYFLEWRILVLRDHLIEDYLNNPEKSVVDYNKKIKNQA